MTLFSASALQSLRFLIRVTAKIIHKDKKKAATKPSQQSMMAKACRESAQSEASAQEAFLVAHNNLVPCEKSQNVPKNLSCESIDKLEAVKMPYAYFKNKEQQHTKKTSIVKRERKFLTQKSLPNIEEDNEYLRIKNDLAVFEEL